jgi:hypothetical protein
MRRGARARSQLCVQTPTVGAPAHYVGTHPGRCVALRPAALRYGAVRPATLRRGAQVRRDALRHVAHLLGTVHCSAVRRDTHRTSARREKSRLTTAAGMRWFPLRPVAPCAPSLRANCAPHCATRRKNAHRFEPAPARKSRAFTTRPGYSLNSYALSFQSSGVSCTAAHAHPPGRGVAPRVKSRWECCGSKSLVQSN